METAGKMMDDLRRAIADAEELLRATADQAKPKLQELEARVREHPWAAVGVAAGIGLIVGMLLSRK
ncbi:MAG: hypothetical protein A3G28_06410 [Betaproteobacteria bacterium RIFCSPLOWO2_12_FULL_68_19]|nr:MAG: hypothetical protein A3G28_06410 [Betaproteobacteria bacterium RIFCSPLOWO2_12_FULL_68_19]